MEIYLMQHGLAVSEMEDPERPLSAQGRKQIEVSAAAMAKMDLRFDLIIASTKSRSRQTAEIIAKTLDYPLKAIVQTEAAKPSASPQELVNFLKQHREKQAIFVAGHLPSLTETASLLLAGKDGVKVRFENGGLCCLLLDDPDSLSAELKYNMTWQELELVAH